MFKIPIFREAILYMGCIPATKGHIGHMLKKGNSVVIIPGGAKEMVACKKGSQEESWYLNDHKGFIRIAEEHGVPIVPLYIEGEQDLFTYYFKSDWLNSLIKSVGWLHMDPIGLIQTILPHNLSLWHSAFYSQEQITRTHIGTPFRVEGTVEKSHNAYLEHVRTLFDSVHKGTRKLTIQ